MDYRNMRESLGELEKAVATLACGSCSHSILILPNFHLCFYNLIETRYMFSMMALSYVAPSICWGFINRRAGGQLVFTAGQNFLNLSTLYEKLDKGSGYITTRAILLGHLLITNYHVANWQQHNLVHKAMQR